jgi:hypothetical protein
MAGCLKDAKRNGFLIAGCWYLPLGAVESVAHGLGGFGAENAIVQ